MDNVKRGIEARGGTMDSFLYMQVFFCLRTDTADSTDAHRQRRRRGLSKVLYRSGQRLLDVLAEWCAAAVVLCAVVDSGQLAD